jgi:succinate dehydrogenase/fumarate reductase flavoprotein subunit
VVNQAAIYQTASRGFDMVRRLERYGVKFEKDAAGEYNVRRVHRSGSYVLPMPEGRDIKKVLYRVLRQRSMRERIRVENRVMPVRVLITGRRVRSRVVRRKARARARNDHAQQGQDVHGTDPECRPSGSTHGQPGPSRPAR